MKKMKKVMLIMLIAVLALFVLQSIVSATPLNLQRRLIILAEAIQLMGQQSFQH